VISFFVVRVLLFLVAVLCFAMPSSAQTAALSPHAFMSAVIDSLADAQTVLELQDEGSRPAEADTFNTEALLTKARNARNRLLRAGGSLDEFQESETELVRKGAEALVLVYGGLAALEGKRIALVEAAADARRYLAEQNYLLGLLVESVDASSYALVDFERSRPAANQRYLRITTAEREDLLRQLERHFPYSSAQQDVRGAQRAPEVSAAQLRTWLNREEWVPSDAR
jgi:hypothetical protein